VFDFRYHALSLAAVFLALGIGIVLGVTIGDSLVSETERSLRSNLRGDVVEARDRAERLEGDLDQRNAFIERALPALLEDRLDGERVAILAFGSLPDDVSGPVEDAIEDAGGEVDSTSVIEIPPDERALGDVVGGRFERLGSDVDLLRELGERIGRSVAVGGRLAQRLERRLDDDFRGDYAGAGAIVVYRDPQDDLPETAVALEEAIVDGLLSAGVPVVGVERGGTDPSQVPFFEENDLTSVDSVDVPAGRAALVFALEGARGSFGFKDTADAPLPEPPARR
jgi:hypothetical protein